jgi:pectate lyase
MGNKSFLLLSIVVAFFSGINAQTIIENKVYSTTLDIYGHSWDNAIIRNCTFQNTVLSDAIRIADADNVRIENCIFKNIQGNGIRLHPAGSSNGIII